MGCCASRECCCPAVLGTLQAELISADFNGKSVTLVLPQTLHKRD